MSTPYYGLLISLLVFHLAGCGDSPQEPAPNRALSAADLTHALHLSPHVPGHVAARLDRIERRRDLVTEHLTLRVDANEIPAIASYSTLGESQRLRAVLLMPGSPNLKEHLINPLDLLPAWADRGFFILSIDRPFHGGRPGDREDEIRRRGLPPVYGDYVADLLSALDYLTQRPEVDAGRIGMVGLSTGGMEALIMGALDPRIRVIVSVSGQLTWPEVFGSGSWKRLFAGLPVADSLMDRGVSGDHALRILSQTMPGLASIDAARIAPLLAPRPLLLLGGTNDLLVPVASMQATAATARAAYEAAGAPDALVVSLEPGRGHAFSRQMQAQALAWCERWL